MHIFRRGGPVRLRKIHRNVKPIGEFVLPKGGQRRPPYRGLKVSEVCVGDDAYIVPAECTDFTEISGEFERAIGSMWASTPTNLPEGVEHPGKLHKNHRLGCFGSRAGFLVPVGEIVQKAADGKRRGRVFAQRKTERPAGRNAERADGDFVGNPAQD